MHPGEMLISPPDTATITMSCWSQKLSDTTLKEDHSLTHQTLIVVVSSKTNFAMKGGKIRLDRLPKLSRVKWVTKHPPVDWSKQVDASIHIPMTGMSKVLMVAMVLMTPWSLIMLTTVPTVDATHRSTGVQSHNLEPPNPRQSKQQEGHVIGRRNAVEVVGAINYDSQTNTEEDTGCPTILSFNCKPTIYTQPCGVKTYTAVICAQS